MKKYILLIATIFLFFISCDEVSGKKEDQKQVEAFFSEYMKANADANLEKVDGYHFVNFRTIWGISGDIYKKTSYVVNKIDIYTETVKKGSLDMKETTAVMNVTIKSPDLKDLLSEFDKTSRLESLTLGKSNLAKLEIIRMEVSKFIRERLESGNFKYTENTVNINFEKIPLGEWELSYGKNSSFFNIFIADSYKFKGIDMTVGELALTPIRGDELALQIKEAEDKLTKGEKSTEIYKSLLFYYSSQTDPKPEKGMKTLQRLINDFPDYPVGYERMAFTLYNMKDKSNYKEVLEYAEKAVDIYKKIENKEINPNKYPEFRVVGYNRQYIADLYDLMISCHREMEEYQKAIDTFTRGKEYLKYNTPPADYSHLINMLKKDNEKLKLSIGNEQYKKNKKVLSWF